MIYIYIYIYIKKMRNCGIDDVAFLECDKNGIDYKYERGTWVFL
jgi:hypothetical protein